MAGLGLKTPLRPSQALRQTDNSLGFTMRPNRSKRNRAPQQKCKRVKSGRGPRNAAIERIILKAGGSGLALPPKLLSDVFCARCTMRRSPIGGCDGVDALEGRLRQRTKEEVSFV